MALKKYIDDLENKSVILNLYLDDDKAGLDLVAKLISSKNVNRIKRKNYFLLDEILDKKILSIISNLNLNNELELQARLNLLSDRLQYPAKYRIIGNKSVIGLGGKFSAGKSMFINSIIHNDKLPVDQAPSTSVPTYIINNCKDNIFAYTNKGVGVELDADALKAISHGFQRKYGLGLAQYISFISISVSDFWNNIALLDTPGYNKADTNVMQAYTDSEKAYSQLKTIDYLIWLVDVQNGTLTDDDVNFIKKINLNTKILIVLNKCDLRPESDCDIVLEEIKLVCESSGILVFDIVKYSSMYPESMNGIDKINAFINYAQKRESKVEDIELSIGNVLDGLHKEINKKIKVLQTTRNEIGEAIFKSQAILELKALISMYGNLNSEVTRLTKASKELSKYEENIKYLLSNL